MAPPRLARGMAAGAAGTTALNVVTYLDMAIRGRPASSVPEDAAKVLAGRVGIGVGDGETARNRLSGAGALMGLVTGVTAGAAWSLAEPLARRLPRPLAAAAAGLAVMAATDASSVRLGVTDPATWSPADWVSDVVPHVAYGLVTVATYDRLRRAGRPGRGAPPSALGRRGESSTGTGVAVARRWTAGAGRAGAGEREHSWSGRCAQAGEGGGARRAVDAAQPA